MAAARAAAREASRRPAPTPSDNHSSVGCEYYAVDMDAARARRTTRASRCSSRTCRRRRSHIDGRLGRPGDRPREVREAAAGPGHVADVRRVRSGGRPRTRRRSRSCSSRTRRVDLGERRVPGARRDRRRRAGPRHRRRQRVPHHDRHAGRRVSDAAVRRRQGGGDRRVAADPDVARGARTTSRSARTTYRGAPPINDPDGPVAQHRRAGRTTRRSRCGRRRRSPRAAACRPVPRTSRTR